MKQNIIDIAVIGGGASGLAAAISCSRTAKIKNKCLKICLFEKSDTLGKPILKTGNGRCNFSNCFAETEKISEYYNQKFCKSVFSSAKKEVSGLQLFRCQENDADLPAAYQMFESLGLTCVIEDDGRMYPSTGKASSVVDVLDYELQSSDVSIKLNHQLESIKYEKFYTLKFKNGYGVQAKKIILCSGGGSLSKTILSDSYTPTKKILGSIKTNTKFIKQLDGIRVKAKCSILSNDGREQSCEYGEVLFRKYGLSGICIFNLSRYLIENSKQQICLDLSPNDNLEEVYDDLMFRFEKWQNDGCVPIKRLTAGTMLPQLSLAVCKFAKLNPDKITDKDILKLAKAIKNISVEAFDIWDKDLCQVSRGGVKVSFVDPNKMEHKNYKNMYICGELLDVDGPCGGFNLHWAWTSGILAGIYSV